MQRLKPPEAPVLTAPRTNLLLTWVRRLSAPKESPRLRGLLAPVITSPYSSQSNLAQEPSTSLDKPQERTNQFHRAADPAPTTTRLIPTQMASLSVLREARRWNLRPVQVTTALRRPPPKSTRQRLSLLISARVLAGNTLNLWMRMAVQLLTTSLSNSDQTQMESRSVCVEQKSKMPTLAPATTSQRSTWLGLARLLSTSKLRLQGKT